MTFQEYINSLEKTNPLYYVGLKYLREVWDAARTGPVKEQMYEALKESVETYEDWFDDGEQCEYIQRSKRAIKAYEEDEDGR